ncbi:hypothetical protein [Agarivorans sp. 1_MG-2023]|uniref:hypothetical protein n=1 Tax=Agarivorans sp. 1_MG-2023 TaxID=3062634 RepID=UPI0026E11F48|nr:hypothetical protein [Agarivorans sp. 1_MG-2023]MDO6764719.1 hypothetical protein [Agarivorans sp. 1_MG-2023]
MKYKLLVSGISCIALLLSGCGGGSDGGSAGGDSPSTPLITPEPLKDINILLEGSEVYPGLRLLVGSADGFSDHEYTMNQRYSDSGITVETGSTVEVEGELIESLAISTTASESEAYLKLVANKSMDLSEFESSGAFVLLMKVGLATYVDNTVDWNDIVGQFNLFSMQTNLGTSDGEGNVIDYVNRANMFFHQTKMQEIQANGEWNAVLIPVSCLVNNTDARGDFDIAQVDEILRLDMRNGATDYELASVALIKDAELGSDPQSLCHFSYAPIDSLL